MTVIQAGMVCCGEANDVDRRRWSRVRGGGCEMVVPQLVKRKGDGDVDGDGDGDGGGGRVDDCIRYTDPLLKAAIKSDWKVAKHLINKKPELLRSSITSFGDTALHLAVRIKRSKHAEKFVTKLVDMMDKEDLALQNESFNTALYLAAAAGDINAVKPMVEKNRILTTIPGDVGGTTMPLYAAAFYANFEVVKYLYENSNDLCDDGWNSENRGLLLQRCVDGDMFGKLFSFFQKLNKLKKCLVFWQL
ncbi:putative ankyrin repeat-containing domain-containing protein [Helianthus anomalus]